jgi:hypothetical protein
MLFVVRDSGGWMACKLNLPGRHAQVLFNHKMKWNCGSFDNSDRCLFEHSAPVITLIFCFAHQQFRGEDNYCTSPYSLLASETTRALVNLSFLMRPLLFLETYYKHTDIYIFISTYFYEYTYTHSIFMSASERLNRFNLEIHKVGHQKRLAVRRCLLLKE